MKMMKKFAALGLAIALTLGMSTTAMAATINVQDTVKDAKYVAYKIFDAVAGTGDAVSYKIPAGSDIASAEGFGDVFTMQNNGGDTYVWKTEGVADSSVVAFLEKYLKGKTGTEVTATGNELTFDNLDPGYYYVKSNVNGGAVVMLGTTTDTATIYEKNSQAGWGDGGKEAEGETYSVGDTINYTLTYENAVNHNQYENAEGKKVTEKVYQYVVKDTLPDGIDLNTTSIQVTVNGTDISDLNHPYTSKENGITTRGFEITIPWAATENADTTNDFFYDAPAVIVVTYSAKMVDSVTPGVELKNTATINPNTRTSDPGASDIVYTGQLTMDKVDAKNSNTKLKGAEFKIINTETVTEGTTKYLVQNAAGEFSWTSTASDGTTFTTDDNGAFVVKGLKAGDYWLLETKAPNGYNLMTKAEKFSIALDDKTTTDKNELLVTATVANSVGTQLPSTGGIGTTIFYVVGGILVAAAVVLLVTKKRMSNRA